MRIITLKNVSQKIDNTPMAAIEINTIKKSKSFKKNQQKLQRNQEQKKKKN